MSITTAALDYTINQRRLDAIDKFSRALYNLIAHCADENIPIAIGRFDLHDDERQDLLRANAFTLIHLRDLGLACTYALKHTTNAAATTAARQEIETVWRNLGGIVPPPGAYNPHLSWRLP
jgi:hypothetical protein